MKTPTIKLFDKEYSIVFDYGTLRELANVWDLKTPSQVEKNILKVLNKSATNADLSFADIDILRDTFYAAIKMNNEAVPFTADKMMNYIMSTPGVLGEFTKHYVESLPKNEPVNPNVRKGRKKQ